MKIFITGVESFVAKELISQCDRQGIELCGCDSIPTADKRFIKADICSDNIADIIPDQVDAIVHLAALSTDNQCRDNANNCFRVNVMGTLNMIEAAVAKKAKQFIFASSEWVYDSFDSDQTKDEDSVINIANHKSEYALSKALSEANLNQKYQHGFCPVTILRFGIIYGPREKGKGGGSAVESLFNSVKTKDEITVGSLKTGRCFIHVSDIANGIIKSIGLEGFNIINLQGDRLVTLGDIIEAAKKKVNRKPKIVEINPTDISVRKVSNEKARRILDWKPQVDLDKGLETLSQSK